MKKTIILMQILKLFLWILCMHTILYSTYINQQVNLDLDERKKIPLAVIKSVENYSFQLGRYGY
jgi:hypothetical protein